ncbi:nitrite reductase small subunit NirD [Litoribrevibacter euphylliae]|uniref:Nitrite reductase small subunit NirD n=1 Tax=Litoribrevibacter euphylliae TaxID=1834034 RepID=A0ABV7HDJ7_9GAMM
MSENWIEVCSLDDIVPDTGVCALIEDKQVALFKTRTGELFAIDNFDPFSKANVLSRGIVGSLGDKLVVASPVYKQHFCLATGECLEDESVKLNVYPVKAANDKIAVQAG